METLADIANAWTFSSFKSFVHRHVLESESLKFRMALRSARRFVIDDDFMNALVENSHVPQDKMLARCDLANLPFEKVWIEFDNHARINAQHRIGTSAAPLPGTPTKVGFLLQRYKADDPTEWFAQCFSTLPGENETDSGITSVAYQFSSKIGGFDDETFAALPWGYISKTPHDLWKRGRAIIAPFWQPIMQHIRKDAFVEELHEGRGDMRFLITLLAMINNVPTKYVFRPSAGYYTSKAKRHQFLDSSTIYIQPGRVSTVNIAKKYLNNAIRMRRHEVRGYWRHHYTNPRCSIENHVWENNTCTKCGTIRKWINEYARGDASIGYVMHNYVVKK